MILKFRVSEQTISALNTKSVPRIGSKDYLVFQFSFSNDWEGLTKTAYLQRDSVSVPIEIKDGLVEVPEWFTEQESFNVTIFGTDGTKEVPTNVVAIKLEKSNDLWVKDAPEPTPSWITELIDLSNHPPIPGSNGLWLLWDTDRNEYTESQLPLPEATTGGTSDHSKLKNRDAAGQHPMSAITGLVDALAGKQPTGNYLTEEQDPTVPDWAKQPQKPAYTAQEVGALPDTTHIPTALSELSEDATHRVVTDAEKATWSAKSNFTGSYNDLTDKPVIPTVPVQSVNGKTGAVVLSAEDVGALPDSTVIPAPYTLPIASPTVLGGVRPVAKTDAMTQSVGVDETGGLWAPPGSGGSAGTDNWELINTIAVEGDSTVSVTFSEDSNGEPFALKKFYLIANTSAKPTYMAARINGQHHNMQFASGVLTASNLNKNNPLRILWEIISSGFYMMSNSNSGSLLLRMDGENAGYGNVQSHIAAVNTVSFVWGTGDAYANGDTFTLYGVRA